MAVTTKGRWRGVTQALGGIRRRMRAASDGRRRRPRPGGRGGRRLLRLRRVPRLAPGRFGRGVRSRRVATTRREDPCGSGWIERPRSGEAHYYRAWLALVDERPPEAVEAVERAQELGFDRAALEVLAGIYQARAGRINDAEPVLRGPSTAGSGAAGRGRPRARPHLPGDLSADPGGRGRRALPGLVPTDPQPYLWSNEIGSRSDAKPADPDPQLPGGAGTRPRPGQGPAGAGRAAQQGSPVRRGRAGVSRLPAPQSPGRRGDGRPGPQRLPGRRHRGGRPGTSRRPWRSTPASADALKELAQLDMRFGRFDQARRRLELLTQIEPVRPLSPLFLLPGPQARRASRRRSRVEIGAGGADPRASTTELDQAPVQHPQGPRRPGVAMRGRPVDARPTATPTRA